MPEGFDSRGESGETSEESLEDIRQELLEKYEQENEPSEQSLAEGTANEHVTNRTEKRENRPEMGDTGGDSPDEMAAEDWRPRLEDASLREGEVENSGGSLEELREQLRQKYDQSEVPEVEDAGKLQPETSTAKEETQTALGERDEPRVSEGPSVNSGRLDSLVEMQGPTAEQEAKPETREGHPDVASALASNLPGSVAAEDLEYYNFQVDDIEPRTIDEWDVEPRFLGSVGHQRGDMLRLPDSDLERAGTNLDELENREILEVTLRDVSDEGVSFRTVFGRYDAENRRAEVYLGNDLAREGHEFLPEMVESYSEKKIVNDYNEHKCEHLDNVRLELEKDEVFLNVDGRRIPLEDRQLVTNGSEVALKGRIADRDDFKVSYDGTRSTARLGRGYVVNEMKTEGDELVVNYSQSRNEKHDHRVYLEHVDEPERPSLNQFDSPEMYEHIKMFDHPERIEGMYQFALDKAAQWEIQNLLDEALGRNGNQYGVMKAEISERLVPNLLELVGWERLAWHPFNESRKEGASANGTDWLVRAPDGKLVLMEVKWWTDRERAEYRAEPQVEKDFRDHQDYRGERIVGAYVGIVDWDVGDALMKVYLKWIQLGEGLE